MIKALKVMLLGGVLVGCSDSDALSRIEDIAGATVSTEPVARVKINPWSVTVQAGATKQLTAVLTDASGKQLTGRAVTWSTNRPHIATVDANGMVTAVDSGLATITASSEGQNGYAAVRVNGTAPAPAPVASVTISPTSATVVVGQTVQLTATARDANNNVLTGRAISWSTSNAAVATVDSTGLVTAVGQGGATINATAEGQTGAAAITVNVPQPTVASVSVSPATASVEQGQTVQLTATARSSDGTVISGQTFSWRSSNTAVATVNTSGVVSGVAAGTATITATTGTVSGSGSVTVTSTPTPPPPPPGSSQALFYSDWRTRIGNAETAISDGGKWNWMSANASDNGSIIEAPAGFSTHRVLRVASNGVRDGWLAPTVTTLGEIPIGSARNYRWEHAFHEPALADAGQHPIQDGGAVSQSNWYMSTINGGRNLAAGQWGLEYVFGGNPSWNHTKFTLGAAEGQFTQLQKGRVYRHEIQIVRVSATQFRFHVWIHDAAGNLLYDADDFRSRDGSTRLTDYLHTFNSIANTSTFLIGLNGIGNSPPWPIHSSDQAAFAIVQGLAERQQIGPYGSVEGEVRR